jgi:hypothetical protein
MGKRGRGDVSLGEVALPILLWDGSLGEVALPWGEMGNGEDYRHLVLR